MDKQKKIKPQSFPRKLYDILEANVEDSSSQNHPSPGLCWSPNGSFIYFRPKVFDQEESKLYFQGTRYNSFVRRLYRFHFDRIIEDEDHDGAVKTHPAGVHVYQNPNFQRGKPDRLSRIEVDNKRVYRRAITGLITEKKNKKTKKEQKSALPSPHSCPPTAVNISVAASRLQHSQSRLETDLASFCAPSSSPAGAGQHYMQLQHKSRLHNLLLLQHSIRSQVNQQAADNGIVPNQIPITHSYAGDPTTQITSTGRANSLASLPIAASSNDIIGRSLTVQHGQAGLRLNPLGLQQYTRSQSSSSLIAIATRPLLQEGFPSSPSSSPRSVASVPASLGADTITASDDNLDAMLLDVRRRRIELEAANARDDILRSMLLNRWSSQGYSQFLS